MNENQAEKQIIQRFIRNFSSYPFQEIIRRKKIKKISFSSLKCCFHNVILFFSGYM